MIGLFNPRAQAAGCLTTLYDDEYYCDEKSVYSYCRSEHDEQGASGFEVYRSIYCDLTRDNDDELIELIAKQFGAEDPNWNEDIVRFILLESGHKSISSFILEEDYYLSDMPEKVLDAYFGAKPTDELARLDEKLREKNTPLQKGNLAAQERIYSRVKSAYDREKITYQAKESLKQKFKAREMWADGSLSDNAPFDLIVDLNLIEIVMFGSLATWTDDVYSWPPSDTEDDGTGLDADGGAPGGADVDGGAGAEDDEDPQTVEGEGPSDTPQYGCLTDDELDALEEANDGADLADLLGIEPETGSAEIPPDCGNGIVDGSGEACDDGNNVSGDGCSQNCQLEIGPDLSCKDPASVTFKPFIPSTDGDDRGTGVGGVGDEEGGIPPDCPPGTTPVNMVLVAGLGLAQPILQSPNYSPDTGGTLQEYPDTNAPDCPAGWSAAEITIAQPQFESTEELGEQVEAEEDIIAEETHTADFLRCIPQELCADFDDARQFLYESVLKGGDDPDDWQSLEKEDVKRMSIDAIEALACISIEKITRPESTYPVTEGCINCHILGMSDILTGILEKNVAPLENSMQAWGLSNRWGPNLSFDVDVLVGKGTEAVFPSDKYADMTPAEETSLFIGQLLQDTKQQLDTNEIRPVTDSVANLNYENIIQKNLQSKNKANEEFFKGLRNYSLVIDAEAVSKQIYNDVPNLLDQMLASFKRLQNTYSGLAFVVTFHEKEACTFD